MTRSAIFDTLAEAKAWAMAIIGDGPFTARFERTRDGKRRVTVTTGAQQ